MRRRTAPAPTLANPSAALEPTPRPDGGIRISERSVRRWTWPDPLRTAPLACKRDAWYMIRARLVDSVAPRGHVLIHLHTPNGVASQVVPLDRLAHAGGVDHCGWFETPLKAEALALELIPTSPSIAGLEIVEVSERDPKCHPLANAPRWSSMPAPAWLSGVVLPASLAALGPRVHWTSPRIARPPRSLAELRRLSRGAVCVLDPEWAAALDLTWSDVESLAAESWLIVDLPTAARLLTAAGVCDARTRLFHDRDGMMSARNVYSDVPTRGLALEDCVPYATIDAKGRFATRVLRASRSWKRYADEVGFAAVLSSETPWAEHHADVLSAARPMAHGELIITDLPWLVAGACGPLAAPQIVGHLLDMHLGGPLPDYLQFWNRWNEIVIVVRDMADLARRYAPLRPVRWASADTRVAHLGVAFVTTNEPRRQLVLQTGRVDSAAPHDGVPCEPMAIFMRWLAREWREQTPWARRFCRDINIIWQFDAGDGLKYVCDYDSAATLPSAPTEMVRVATSTGPMPPATNGQHEHLILNAHEGLLGDTSLIALDALHRALVERIERCTPAEKR